jgi:Cys-tRNA(Pro)/Cys-tRNA(Cys) deacylase
VGARATRRVPLSGTPATTALTRLGIAFGEHAYQHDPGAASYGLEAAEALGVPPAQVFKTLVVQGDRGLAVGVVPVDRQLDLKALAAALGLKRLAMAQTGDAERATGYVLGGISPIGQRRALPTVLDASATGFDRVYVSGGRRGLDVSLSPDDLVSATGAVLAPIAR